MKASICRLVAGSLLTSLLAACGTPTTKEESGAAIGIATGAAIGSQIGSGSGRTAAVIGGAVVGGAIGASVGRRLDDQDKRNLSAITERVLATGTAQAYASPSTGARVTVRPDGAPTYEHALRLHAMVSPAVGTNYQLRAERRTVYAKTDMELRAAPRLTSKSTRLYRRGERAEVVASIPGSQYRLISINGTAVGYGRAGYLADRREDVPYPRYVASATSSKSPSRGYSGTPRKLMLRGECRRIEQITRYPNGSTETALAKYCKQPPSSWKQV